MARVENLPGYVCLRFAKQPYELTKYDYFKLSDDKLCVMGTGNPPEIPHGSFSSGHWYAVVSKDHLPPNVTKSFPVALQYRSKKDKIKGDNEFVYLPDRIMLSFENNEKMKQFLETLKEEEILVRWEMLHSCVIKVPDDLSVLEYITKLSKIDLIQTIEGYPVPMINSYELIFKKMIQ